MDHEFFSETYSEAREKFRSAATQAGAELQSYPIANGLDQDLTMDVARWGDRDARASLVVSSGVHGVEGFLGSAIQLAWLRDTARDLNHQPQGIRFVFVHAVNPFGFANQRRFNEENVDLNRNFLSDDSEYRGAPQGYLALNNFLNPRRAEIEKTSFSQCAYLLYTWN